MQVCALRAEILLYISHLLLEAVARIVATVLETPANAFGHLDICVCDMR